MAEATTGYANGQTENPTYEEVCSGRTGHAEAVHLRYDPDLVTLTSLLHHFFRIIDPTTLNRQGNDRGVQYRSGIYYRDAEDLPVIQAVIAAVQPEYRQPIVTEVLPLANFYPAEEYHQDYLDKNPGGYCHVDFSTLTAAHSGINNANTNDHTNLENLYQKPDPKTLRQKLTPLQYAVTQHDETEPPFQNQYWDQKKQGSTLMWLRENPCLARKISMMPVVVGPVSPSRSTRRASLTTGTTVLGWIGSKPAAESATPTLGTSSTTGQWKKEAAGFVSIVPPSVLFPSTEWRKKATVPLFRS